MRSILHSPVKLGWLAACALAPFLSMLPARADEETSIFKDKKLEEAVRPYVFSKRNTDQPITEKDVANLSTIKAREAGIRDLAGLEKCRSLASLDLAGNEITDLQPLAGLPRLQFLDLAWNKVSDLGPIKENVALQYLELSRNKVEDIQVLAGLTNLASVYLGHNLIADAKPVTGLPRLASLYLEHNRLKSIEGLGQVKTLWTLSLSGNQIEDLTPLQGLQGIYQLFLEDNKIRDLQPLVDMGKADTAQRFIPFVNIYLKGNPLSPAASEAQWNALREMGARLHR